MEQKAIIELEQQRHRAKHDRTLTKTEELAGLITSDSFLNGTGELAARPVLKYQTNAAAAVAAPIRLTVKLLRKSDPRWNLLMDKLGG